MPRRGQRSLSPSFSIREVRQRMSTVADSSLNNVTNLRVVNKRDPEADRFLLNSPNYGPRNRINSAQIAGKTRTIAGTVQ